MTALHSTPRLFSTKLVAVRLGILVVAIGLGVWGKNTFLPPLPRGAYPVLSTLHWAGRISTRSNYPPSRWLPNGDLAYLETNARGMLQVCYQKMSASGPVGEVRHGPELPNGPYSSTFYPSPDEQWVACRMPSAPGPSQFFLLSADGKNTRACAAAGEIFTSWLPNSKGFLAITYTPTYAVKVYSLDSPTGKTLSGPNEWDMPTWVTTVANGKSFLISSRFNKQFPNGGMSGNYPNLTLRSFNLVHPEVAEQRWQAPVPPGVDFGYAYPSPDNQHILWATASMKPSLFVQWFGRFLPVTPQKPTIHVSYFLSDMQGNHRHEILDATSGRGWTIIPTWTPDSKHMSFLYKDQLYFVPVE